MNRARLSVTEDGTKIGPLALLDGSVESEVQLLAVTLGEGFNVLYSQVLA